MLKKNTPVTEEEMQQALDAIEQYGGATEEASQRLGISIRTIQHRAQRGRDAGLKPSGQVKAKANPAVAPKQSKRNIQDLSVKEIERILIAVKKTEEKKLVERLEDNEALAYKHKIKTLETQLTAYRKDELNSKYIRTKILGLAAETPNVPAWIGKTSISKPSKNITGVPTLFASDWHWGEVIDPGQVGDVNKFNLDIAHKRAQELINKTIELLFNHMAHPNYPGIVFALGGDMFSGNIHEELKATNEMEVLPCLMDIFGVLIWCIEVLVDRFGKVFVPCVSGNHGRNTFKIQMKERNHTNFDWLLYVLLEKHFKNDSRVTFMIPEGTDAYYKVFNHRYLLTHGDLLGRGGDGIIGAIGTIIRGDHRKRSRNTQIDMGYDTLLCGHFHQYISMQRVIVNGSLKGYDEYAFACNFPFEVPRQALWLTHPQHGITYSMPVNVDKGLLLPNTPWVSVK